MKLIETKRKWENYTAHLGKMVHKPMDKLVFNLKESLNGRFSAVFGARLRAIRVFLRNVQARGDAGLRSGTIV